MRAQLTSAARAVDVEARDARYQQHVQALVVHQNEAHGCYWAGLAVKGAFTTEGGLGGEEAVTCAALAAGKAAGRVAAEGHGELCAAGQERAWSYFLLALLDDIEAELRLLLDSLAGR